MTLFALTWISVYDVKNKKLKLKSWQKMIIFLKWIKRQGDQFFFFKTEGGVVKVKSKTHGNLDIIVDEKLRKRLSRASKQDFESWY